MLSAKRLISLLCLSCVVSFLSFNGLSGQQASLDFLPESGYFAHEWGTFTTLSRSDGRLLAGLSKEEEALPKFVYSHSHRSFKPLNGLALAKGVSAPVRNVTVKLETPVIYFYGKKEQNVDVRVDFKGGSISQFV